MIMFVSFILKVLLLTSSIQSFRLNSFRYLMRKISSSAKTPLTIKYDTLWLEQKLDHFNEDDNRKWKMRYFKSSDLWKPTGPLYIFLGGESQAYPDDSNYGLTYELARETNGALYGTEHRYYGKSVPINRTEVKNLKYLSVKQALADNAYLIRTIKLDPVFRESKVVVIGCSYSGNLAAWMRLLYPDLVDAAIASSAPVLAKKDFYEYLEKVSDDFARYGTDGCWNTINDRFKEYDNMFMTIEGIEKLKKDENICPENDMSIPENRQLFFSEKIDPFMSIAQYGNIKQIKDQCRTLNTLNATLFFDKVNLLDEQKECYDYDFYKMVNDFKNQITDDVCWTYQTCTEFGYFQSTSFDKQPFTNNIPVDFYVKMCIGVFGPQFNESRIDRGIDDINKMFGGLKPNVTNVVFVNGDLDPWSRLSILEDLSHNAPAILIPRSSHCEVLYASRDDDEKELKEARKKIKYWIKKWIGIHDVGYN